MFWRDSLEDWPKRDLVIAVRVPMRFSMRMIRPSKQRPRCLCAALALVSVALAPSLACSDEDEGGGGPGASGVDRGKYIDELTPQERQKFCAWSTPAQGGAGEHDCDGLTLETPSVQECSEDNADVHCSVAMAEDCVTSTGGEACKIFETQPCVAFLTCAFENEATVERRIPFAGVLDGSLQGPAATTGP